MMMMADNDALAVAMRTFLDQFVALLMVFLNQWTSSGIALYCDYWD